MEGLSFSLLVRKISRHVLTRRAAIITGEACCSPPTRVVRVCFLVFRHTESRQVRCMTNRAATVLHRTSPGPRSKAGVCCTNEGRPKTRTKSKRASWCMNRPYTTATTITARTWRQTNTRNSSLTSKHTPRERMNRISLLHTSKRGSWGLKERNLSPLLTSKRRSWPRATR